MAEPQKTSYQQSDKNFAMLKLVKQYGSVRFAMLLDQFGDQDVCERDARERLQRKLSWLCTTHQLVRHGRGAKATYSLGELAFKPQPGTRAAQYEASPAVGTKCKAEAGPELQRVLAPTYNTFGTRCTTPTAGYYRNNGHTHIASRGVRC